jgi:hypothetical protein
MFMVRSNNLDSSVTNANSWTSTVSSHSITGDSIASSISAIAVAVFLTVVTLGAAMVGWIFIVVTDAETETRWCNVFMAKEEEGAKNRLRKHIENTVECRLGIW